MLSERFATGSMRCTELSRAQRARDVLVRYPLSSENLKHESRHPPKSPIATAIRYGLNQWRVLNVNFIYPLRPAPVQQIDSTAAAHEVARIAMVAARWFLAFRRPRITLDE